MPPTSSSNFKAFTLVELVLVMVLVSIVSIGAAIATRGFLGVGQLTNATQTASSAIRIAQRRALNSSDFAWGVRFNSGSAVVFRGNSYAARTQALDITYFLDGVTPSGVTEVVFTTFTGIPSQTGTLTLSNGTRQTQITINAKGTVLL